MILAVYDISKAMGPDGKAIEPSGEYTSDAVRYVLLSSAKSFPHYAYEHEVILTGFYVLFDLVTRNPLNIRLLRGQKAQRS